MPFAGIEICYCKHQPVFCKAGGNKFNTDRYHSRFLSGIDLVDIGNEFWQFY